MTRPLLLDLFCGEGGAARGYDLAGFDVVGVDTVYACADHEAEARIMADPRSHR